MKLDATTKFQTTSLQELVNQKITEQSNRIQQVTETFKDALMLSNKTYFLEEITKQKAEKKKLKKEVENYKEQVRLNEKTIEDRNDEIANLLKANEMLKQEKAKGKQEMEGLLEKNTKLITKSI